MKKFEEFVKSALKTRYINDLKEWIKVDEQGLQKVGSTLETLADIVNDSV